MIEFLKGLFSQEFMPHGQCLFWKTELLRLYIIGDGLTAIAYYSIPVAIAYFIYKRKDLAFKWVFVLFAIFILLCGTTHLMFIWTLWNPMYRLEIIIKLITAFVSIATAIIVWPIISRALTLPSPTQLRQVNNKLIQEINEHERTEEELRVLQSQLEMKIEDRTINLVNVNLKLEEEIKERQQTGEKLKKYREGLEGIIKGRTRELEKKSDKLEESEKALVYLLEDVNEIRANLEKANTRLKELDRLKSMFIASMSHELRTPLNSIIGFTGIILQGMSGEINPQQNDHLGRVNRSAKHLLALINDILDLSRVEAGKVDVFPEDIVLNEVINEAVDSVRLQANEKRLALDVSVPPGMRMNTDRKRLYQCILNYLSNAVKFTESGTISITAHETNGEVEIIVSDTGIGISKDDKQRLFRPFVRIDSPLHTRIPGTGLGLYLTRKLTTELLGGTVDVQSQPGKGSTFTLRLPREIGE